MYSCISKQYVTELFAGHSKIAQIVAKLISSISDCWLSDPVPQIYRRKSVKLGGSVVSVMLKCLSSFVMRQRRSRRKKLRKKMCSKSQETWSFSIFLFRPCNFPRWMMSKLFFSFYWIWCDLLSINSYLDDCKKNREYSPSKTLHQKSTQQLWGYKLLCEQDSRARQISF